MNERGRHKERTTKTLRMNHENTKLTKDCFKTAFSVNFVSSRFSEVFFVCFVVQDLGVSAFELEAA